MGQSLPPVAEASETRLLLAGSSGPERRIARPDPGEPRWFEPLHVRDVGGARERVAAQVAAGADVVVAPTWRTHRRALLPLGETRRARAWTDAAVRVAREGVDIGLERRAAAATADTVTGQAGADPSRAGASPDVVELARPVPRVAASLPSLDDPEEDDGRLLPREAATERDIREQLGLLTDAEPDLILVEGQRTPAELRFAVDAALETGLPVWVAVSGLGSAEDPERVLAAIAESAAVARSTPEAVLLPVPWWSRTRTELHALVGPIRGALFGPALDLADALDRGAHAIGLLDGASWDRLALVRAALDERDRAAFVLAAERRRRWSAIVSRAAAMTEGGSAAWLASSGEAGTEAALPPGFEWLVIRPDDARQLPDGRFRLVVDATGEPGVVAQGGRWLAHGGLLVLAVSGPLPEVPGCRVVIVDDTAEPHIAVLRREG